MPPRSRSTEDTGPRSAPLTRGAPGPRCGPRPPPAGRRRLAWPPGWPGPRLPISDRWARSTAGRSPECPPLVAASQGRSRRSGQRTRLPGATPASRAGGHAAGPRGTAGSGRGCHGKGRSADRGGAGREGVKFHAEHVGRDTTTAEYDLCRELTTSLPENKRTLADGGPQRRTDPRKGLCRRTVWWSWIAAHQLTDDLPTRTDAALREVVGSVVSLALLHLWIGWWPWESRTPARLS